MNHEYPVINHIEIILPLNLAFSSLVFLYTHFQNIIF